MHYYNDMETLASLFHTNWNDLTPADMQQMQLMSLIHNARNPITLPKATPMQMPIQMPRGGNGGDDFGQGQPVLAHAYGRGKEAAFQLFGILR